MTARLETAASRGSPRHAWRDDTSDALVALSCTQPFGIHVELVEVEPEHARMYGGRDLQDLHDLALAAEWEPLAHLTVANLAN
jgi:hypothetical protein